MKKKIYYIIYSFIQMIAGIFLLFNVSDMAKSLYSVFDEVIKIYPEEMAGQLGKIFTMSLCESMIIGSGVFGVILGVILLILAFTNNFVKKKTLTIILLVIAILSSIQDLMLVLSIITLIVLINDKTVVTGDIVLEKKIKRKKKVGLNKLELMEVTNKEKLFVCMLVLAYATQFFVPVTDSFVFALLFEILFRVGVFALVVYVYWKNFKRDGMELKKNLKQYLLHALKYWGIMILVMLVVGIIRSIFGSGGVSENQQALNSLPIWYVAPLAIIWAPIVEEGLFRVGLRKFIKNDLVFIAVSAISFGLLHTLGQETNFADLFFQTMQYAAMGAVMAVSYVKTNNIFSSMLIHCYQNTFSSVMMFLLSLLA